ncbi:MAG TPA: glycosyltransferase family 1 protein, partial [Desulfobacterales bacterium]|nr:glycosyltransferase family 1 protein [Desulfobacterales bacterium]
MKILHILQDRNFFCEDHNRIGGHIAHIIGVVEAFQKLGHQVTITSFDPVPFWENEKVKYQFFVRKRVSVPGLSGIVTHWSMSAQLLDILKNLSPDMIYLRMSSNIFFCKVHRKFPEIPFVLECNSLLSMGQGYSFLRRLLLKKEDKYYLKHATAISVVSDILKEHIKDRYKFVNPDKILVNPNGVDVNRFHPVPSVKVRKRLGLADGTTVVGFSGNFSSWHRIDLLIRAVQQYPEEIMLLLIGTGPKQLLSVLKQIAKEKNDHRIIFAGPVPFNEMPEYLSACDILAMPQDEYDNHRSPIKLFEYMAMQKPVIASAVGQIAKVITNGENGLLFENRTESI